MFDNSNRLLEARRRLEHNKNNDSLMGGEPYVLEVFGKDPFAPKSESLGVKILNPKDIGASSAPINFAVP